MAAAGRIERPRKNGIKLCPIVVARRMRWISVSPILLVCTTIIWADAPSKHTLLGQARRRLNLDLRCLCGEVFTPQTLRDGFTDRSQTCPDLHCNRYLSGFRHVFGTEASSRPARQIDGRAREVPVNSRPTA